MKISKQLPLGKSLGRGETGMKFSGIQISLRISGLNGSPSKGTQRGPREKRRSRPIRKIKKTLPLLLSAPLQFPNHRYPVLEPKWVFNACRTRRNGPRESLVYLKKSVAMLRRAPFLSTGNCRGDLFSS